MLRKRLLSRREFLCPCHMVVIVLSWLCDAQLPHLHIANECLDSAPQAEEICAHMPVSKHPKDNHPSIPENVAQLDGC